MTPEFPQLVAHKSTRRSFLKRSFAMATGLGITGLVYSGIEACWIHVNRIKLEIPRLPKSWHGTTAVLLTDIHHGPFTSLSYVEKIVEITNAIQPDLILMTGDFVHRHRKYIAPCMNALGNLRAKLGVFAVSGNHEYYEGITEWQNATEDAKIPILANTGRWIEQNNSAIWLAGVDDYWRGKSNVELALKHFNGDEAVLLMNHNPDYVEVMYDTRVSLILSGHTHGGQVVFPFVGAPIMASHFGQKYLHGLVQGPAAKVYVSRGLGTITPPLRFCAPPELTVIELQSPSENLA